MSIDTGQVIPLIQHPADDYLLGWSQDGNGSSSRVIARASSAYGLVGVSDAKIRGEPQLVKPGIDRILPIGLTREGALYYGVVRATEDIYVADLDARTGMVAGTARKAIEQFEGGNFTPAYSRDGKYLAYVSRRATLLIRQTSVMPSVFDRWTRDRNAYSTGRSGGWGSGSLWNPHGPRTTGL